MLPQFHCLLPICQHCACCKSCCCWKGAKRAIHIPFWSNFNSFVQNKSNSPPDVRPITVGEVITRLTSKCVCHLLKDKGAEFFQPFQFGVACSRGAEKILHSLRCCFDDHWADNNFVVFKVDMTNAFNLVSRQAVLDECAQHFPELLAWVSWCYMDSIPFCGIH